MPRSKDGRWTSVCKRPGCDNTFVPRKESHEYCSQACSNKAFPGIGGRKPATGLKPRECLVCSGVFDPYRDNQVTCSRRCRDDIPGTRERKNRQRREDPAQVSRIRNYNRTYQLLSRYGMTVEEHDAKLAAQGGVCMICGQPPDPEGKGSASRLHVDHDHVTQQNRDLVCLNCNQGIGNFMDDPVRMRAAAEYIERHRQAVLAKTGGQA